VIRRPFALLFLVLAAWFLAGCGRFELAGTDEVVVRFQAAREGPSVPRLRGAVEERLALYRIGGTAAVEGPNVSVTTSRRMAPVVRHALSLPSAWRVLPADATRVASVGSARDWTAMVGASDTSCMLFFELGPRGEWTGRCADPKRARAMTPLLSTSGELSMFPEPADVRPDDRIAVGSFFVSRDSLETDALLARARVRPVSAWLEARALPELTFIDATPAKTNMPLAASVIVVPSIFAIAWLFVLRRFDRSQPEPWWLLFATLALGGASAFLAALLERAIANTIPILNPWRVVDATPRGIALTFVSYTVTVGLVEELAKCLGCQLAYLRREFDEPVDGIVYAAAAAAGFSLIENIAYLNQARMSPAVLAARTFLTLPAHVFFSSLWGYGYGRRFVTRSPLSILIGLALSVVLHGAFDTLVTTPKWMPVAIALDAALAVAFVVLVRRLLRYGSGSAPGATVRLVFPTGHLEGFTASTFAFVGSSAALFILCVLAEKNGIEPWALGAAAALLFTFFVAGFGITHFVPLDIVVDHEGVTFSGILRRWSEVASADLEARRNKAHVVLRTTRGDVVRLGVGESPVMERAVDTICARLASK